MCICLKSSSNKAWMKPIYSPSILISDQLAHELKGDSQHPEVLQQSLYQYVVPRIFPTSAIPSKIQVYRKNKQFTEFDLNEHLKHVEWDDDSGQLRLTNFIQAKDYVYEYGCKQEQISMGKVRGRAYDRQGKRFRHFRVEGREDEDSPWFSGSFRSAEGIMQSTGKRTMIHRAQICFDFEDPQVYVKQVLQGVKRRSRTIEFIKYSFYIDNVEMEEAPSPSDNMLRNIKMFVKGNPRFETPISQHCLQLLVYSYKRTMNDILFRSQVIKEQLPIAIPIKSPKKTANYGLLRKQVVFKKNDKIVRLIPKPVILRTNEIGSKSLLISLAITDILLDLNSKINGQFNKFTIFAQLRDTAADKFFTDQENCISYCYSAFNEYIVEPVSANICNRLKSTPSGWFRMYSDREVYEGSKLKRLMVLLNSKLKDYIRDKLVVDFTRLLHYLKKNSPQYIRIESVTDVHSEYALRIELVAILRIDVIVDKGRLFLSQSGDKIIEGLKLIVNKALQMFREIPAPQTIILREIFKSSKFHGTLIIQLPKQLEIENNQTRELGHIIDQIQETINQIVEPLFRYQEVLDAKVDEIGLSTVLAQRNPTYGSIAHTVSEYHKLDQLAERFRDCFLGCGTKLGFFYIDYEIAKTQVLQQLAKRKQAYRKHLLSLKARASSVFYQKVQRLEFELSKKAANFEELAFKNEKARTLDQIVQEEFAYREVRELAGICDEMGCQTEVAQLMIELSNRQMISNAYKCRQNLEEEFRQMQKQEMGSINEQSTDLLQTLQLLSISQNSLLKDHDVRNYRELADKVEYMRRRIDEIKQQNSSILHKKQVLQIQLSDNLTCLIEQMELQFVPFELLWTSLRKWFDLCIVWLNDPVGSFELHEPEKLIRILLADLRVCIKQFGTRNYSTVQQISQLYKQQIQEFEPKLRLLKLLKKQGLSRTHFSDIGMELSKQVGELTLKEAIELGFLEITDEIQVVSNDAWNQFSLENTLTRVRRETESLKFEINFYKDRRFNEIPLIVNYQQLVERIDEILNNLESIRFNPMKHIYEDQIQKLYERSLYVSKSILICQSFQQMFMELHPVFDSTDIAKQMPAENKKFAKILRTWLQLLNYIRKIRLVNDACNSQNIYQKVKSIYTLLENVKKQLINYLQQKRKGFHRFYLLSDSEMFDLFSMSSHSFTMHSLIPKLFDSVSQLVVHEADGLILGVESEHGCQLLLQKPIAYRVMSIENWMNSLEDSIKKTLLHWIREHDQGELGDWLSLIGQDTYIPQMIYLLFELSFTNQTESAMKHGLGQVRERYQSVLNDLVTRKRQGHLPVKAQLILCSVIVLSISKIDIVKRLIHLKVDSVTDFEYSKIFKARYFEEDEDQRARVTLQSMNVEIEYGCHYLGLYSRLVVTNLTQKMQIVYVLAYKYSLGAAAIGPAGTGKTETTKEIAKLLGKACLVYNCSEQFEAQTFIRLLKGLAVTGLWMCFDEFNRLSCQILSVIAEQLSSLQRYRSFGYRMEISFFGDLIWLDPTFQFCVTYNPTYQGHQAIPKPVHELFRNVAVVSPDQLTICVALLLSSGFMMGEELGANVIRVLRSSREIWKGEELYDFSLRALTSIVHLSSKLVVQRNESEQNSVIKALKILNTPKMNEEDYLMFHRILKQIFPSLRQRPSQPQDSQKLDDFQQLLGLRDGIILCGEALSGKQILIQDFTTHSQSYEVIPIYHNVLSVSELYGRLDPTTLLWTDGYFTQILRSHIKKVDTRPDTQTLVVFNGQIYSEWVENLNTVLDSTRKLSLVSGQTINIPQSFKILISCTSLGRATPATVSRSGIIIYHPLHYRTIALNAAKRNQQTEFPDSILDFFTQLLDELQDQYILRMPPRFIMYWTVELLHDLPINYDTFIYFLTQTMTGILNEKGISIYDRFCRRYLPDAWSPFDIMLRRDGSLVAFGPQFSKSVNYERSMSEMSMRQETDSPLQPHQQVQNFADVFIMTPTAFRIRNHCEHYLRNTRNKVLLIFGSSNSCKTRSAVNYLQSLPKHSNALYQLFLNKNTSARALQAKLRGLMVRKSSIKLGAKTGSHNNIFIEDLNMPQQNQFQVNETSEFIRMLMSTKSWYNCKQMTRQWIEDFSIVSDSQFDKHIASVNKNLGVIYRLYRHIEPVFTGSMQPQQIKTIFKGIVSKLCSKQSVCLLQPHLETILSFYESLTHTTCFSRSMFVFSLMDLLRTLKGLVAWNLVGLKSAGLEKLALFELSRTFLSKAANKHQQQQEVYQTLKRHYGILTAPVYRQTQIPVFHNLEGSSPSPQKCEEVININHFTNKMQYICDEYRLINKVDTNIILFPHLITYLIKVYRSLAMEDSHVLIAGLSKCGKKILVRLATHILNLELLTLAPVNQHKEWSESIKKCLKGCYRTKNASLLMFEHGQVEKQYQIEDINSLLNNMDLSGIYSEADMEETTYMMQADLVRKNIEVTNANTWKAFTRYLVDQLHVAILLNPAYQSFALHIQNYPAILKHCTCFYLTEWPEEALSLIAQLYLSEMSARLDFLPKIHSYCASLCSHQQSTLASIWEGMYFHFITMLRQQYDRNHKQLISTKQKYERGLHIIEETEEQLKATKNKIKKLQPAMILIESQTAKTVKRLNMQKSNSEAANDNLMKKTAELDEIISNSKVLKAEIEVKVEIVEQQLRQAWESVSLIKPSHISEVKALANPSELIKLVLAAMVILTYDGPLVREVVERDGHQYVEYSYFETAKKFVLSKDAKSICRMLTEFKREAVTKQMFTRLQQKCLCYKRWEQKQAKNANKAIYYFFIWVQAVVSQYRIFEETRPVRDSLESISNLLSSKEKEVLVVRKQLQVTQNKIMELERVHSAKKQALQEYRFQIHQYERMISRGYELLKEISQEKSKWKQYVADIDERQANNFGDSVLIVATVVYLSHHVYEIRNLIKSQIKSLYRQYQIRCGDKKLPWFLEREETLTFHAMQISDNQFIIDNMKIIGHSAHAVLLLDPEEQGVKYIKNYNWQTEQIAVDKLSESSPILIRTIESAILYGRILFIQVDPSSFNQSLDFVLKPVITKNQLKSSQKMIPIHKQWRIYLYAPTYTNKKCSMELLANVQTVNFKMTSQQLEQRMMEAVVTVQLPLLKNKIEQIYRVNVKDTVNLSDIEEKLLRLFSNEATAQQILQNQQIINTVIHSNRLYQQISNRVNQSNKQKEQIQESKKPYGLKVKNACLIYHNIMHLKSVSSIYAYSYQWFIDLFDTNLHNFEEVLFQEVSKALGKEDKIVVSILLAQIVYSDLPWKCLFGVQNTNLSSPHSLKSDLEENDANCFIKRTNNANITQQKWNHIVNKVHTVSEYLPELQQCFASKWQIFKPVLESAEQRILDAIPSQFAEESLFNRILLVSCFRPECVIRLLTEWIYANMGPSFTDFKPPFGSLVSNSRPSRPILAILDDPSMDGVQKVRQISRDFGSETGISIASIYWQPTQIPQIECSLKSAVELDQWLVMEGVNSLMAAQFIKSYFEDLIILPEKVFRCWIICEDSQLFPERFTQFCDKIRIISAPDYHTRIVSSFYQQVLNRPHNELDYFERNKKRLIGSQLCILHHLIQEFNAYNGRLFRFNQAKSLYTFTEWDLKLILEEIWPFPVTSLLKAITHFLICNIAHGSQMQTYQSIKLLQVNSSTVLESVHTDRILFWQTVWSDENFPKDQAQYLQEVKTKISIQKYEEMFGINEQLKKELQEQSYRRICQLYEQTGLHESQSMRELIRVRLQQVKSDLQACSFWEVRKQLFMKLQTIKKKCSPQSYITYYHLKKQVVAHCRSYQHIYQHVEHYLRTLHSNPHNLNRDSTIASIYGNKTPKQWLGSDKKISPRAFACQLCAKFKTFNDYLTNYENPTYIVDCNLITHPYLFLHNIENKLSIDDKQSTIFIFEPIDNDKMSHFSTGGIEKLSELSMFRLLELEKQHQQTIDSYVLLRGLKCWNIRLRKSDNKVSLNIVKMVQSDLLVLSQNESFGPEPNVSGILLAVSRQRHNILKRLHRQYLCIPLYLHAIEDILEESECLRFVYMKQQGMTQAEAIREKCHLSFQR